VNDDVSPERSDRPTLSLGARRVLAVLEATGRGQRLSTRAVAERAGMSKTAARAALRWLECADLVDKRECTGEVRHNQPQHTYAMTEARRGAVAGRPEARRDRTRGSGLDVSVREG
jgi:DNA-binding IclR family transcriptional regulator